jgi:hypothetical protein
MRWHHAAIIALGLAVGGLCSGGLYRVQVVAHEGTVSLVIRTNRFTGRVDYVGAEGVGLKALKEGAREETEGRLW